ncbi:putative aminoacrylate hydrolase RutD [Pseudomonas asuensis]|uniref:Putative carbamate hydrolase RutD n=1 Tax=Pseudomonas asuensis TaxID=1825787 RepID=A0ABQ2GIN9_9PSED|nr:pyrimidine utilization protein D [Pseudomonas asuensis]GGL98431.1 putative aminoacrylate hydrolase RutD [Pseudomonas asuensis]
MHYEIHGRQDAEVDTIVLSSGLGGAGAFWAPQMAALGERFRVVIYDQTGTGRSPAVIPEGYCIEAMAQDVLDMVDGLCITRCHFMGHALGGLVGLQLALMRPALLISQILVNAWSKPNPHSARCFAVRLNLLNDTGPAAYVQAQPLFLYPADWMLENTERLKVDEAHALAHFPSEENVRRRIAALQAFDIDKDLAQISTPTLVIANQDDMLVPWVCSEHLAKHLPNAQFELLGYGGHASSVTDPDTFNALMLDYLT